METAPDVIAPTVVLHSSCPGFDMLDSRYGGEIGQHPRYRRADLHAKVERGGCSVVRSRHVHAAGLLACPSRLLALHDANPHRDRACLRSLSHAECSGVASHDSTRPSAESCRHRPALPGCAESRRHRRDRRSLGRAAMRRDPETEPARRLRLGSDLPVTPAAPIPMSVRLPAPPASVRTSGARFYPAGTGVNR
jgi:hypothetical protein